MYILKECNIMFGNISISFFILKLKKIFSDIQFVENITSSKIILHQEFEYNLLKKELLFFLL